MIDFDYVKARDVSDALSHIALDSSARFIAGGTNLVDLMKENVARPRRVIDINGLPLAKIEETLDRRSADRCPRSKQRPCL